MGNIVQLGRLGLCDGWGKYDVGLRRLFLWIRRVGNLVYWIWSSWAWVRRLYNGVVGDFMRSVVMGDLVQLGRLCLCDGRGKYGFWRVRLWIRHLGDLVYWI